MGRVRTRLVLVLLLLLVFPFFIRTKALAQSEPASGCSGYKGDVALRGTSWHHRGTLAGINTEVWVGFLKTSDGTWEAPDLIYYGTGGWVSAGSMWLNYTWGSKGTYTIAIYNSNTGCYFQRQINVAESAEWVGSMSLTNSNLSDAVNYPGREICGVLADYDQSVSALPANGSADYSIAPLGTSYNLYRGQPGGAPGVAWMSSNLTAGQSRTISNYSIDLKMAGQTPSQVTWSLSPNNGATAGWDISNLVVYLNCSPDQPPPPPRSTPTPTPTSIPPTSTPTTRPTSTPTPTSAPVCDPNCGAGVCGVRLPNSSCYADWGNVVYGLCCCHMGCIPPVGGVCQYIAGPNSAGNCNWDCNACPPSPTPTLAAGCPACPATVTADSTPRGLGSPPKYNVAVSWSNVSNETGYDIYRCQGVNCTKSANPYTSVNTNVTNYVDNNNNAGFDCGTSLSYWVIPVKAGCAALSCLGTSLTATACTGCVFACPGQPSLTSPDNGFTATSQPIPLQWSAPGSWGTVCPPNVARPHYHLYVSTTNDGSPAGTLNGASGLLTGFPMEVSATSYSLSGLTDGATYFWQVRAENQ